MNFDDIPIGLRINDHRRKTAQNKSGDVSVGQMERKEKWTDEYTRKVVEWGEQGITQVEISRRLKVSQSTINARMNEIQAAEEIK